MNAVEILIRARDEFSNVTGRAVKEFGKVGDSAKALLGMAAAATAVTGVMAAAIKHAADYADEINDMRMKTGLAAEELSVLRYAANQTGTSFEEIATAVQKAERNVQAGSTAFKTIGVEIRTSDGHARKFDDVLKDLFDRFSRMPDGVTKTALAMDIFGKSGANMIPLLNEGAAGFAKFSTEAHNFGKVITDSAAKAADEFNDNLAALEDRLDGAVIKIGGSLIPALNVALEKIQPLLDAPHSMEGITMSIIGAVQGAYQNIQKYGLAGFAGVSPDVPPPPKVKPAPAPPETPEHRAEVARDEASILRSKADIEEFEGKMRVELFRFLRDNDPSDEANKKLEDIIAALHAIQERAREAGDKNAANTVANLYGDLGEAKLATAEREMLAQWKDVIDYGHHLYQLDQEARERQAKFLESFRDGAGEVWDAFYQKGRSVFSSLANLAKGLLNSIGRSLFQDLATMVVGGGRGNGLLASVFAAGGIGGGGQGGSAGGGGGLGGGLLNAGLLSHLVHLGGTTVSAVAPGAGGLGGVLTSTSATTVLGMGLSTAIPVIGGIIGGAFLLSKLLGHHTQEAKFYEDPLKNGPVNKMFTFDAYEVLRNIDRNTRGLGTRSMKQVVVAGMSDISRDDRLRSDLGASMLGID